MAKSQISPECNAEIVEHLRNWSQYADNPELIREWENGINFIHSFGLISLSQWRELSELAAGEV